MVLTQKTTQMLCTIDVTKAFSSKFTCALAHLLPDFNVLVAFKSALVLAVRSATRQVIDLACREEFDQDTCQSTP